MSIFQKSILNSTKQDESLVAQRWAKFQSYLAKISAIKGFKEEVYQDGFFKDIFEECLGYTLKTTNPNDFNLEREKKNETDSKKADGVIYVNGEIIGVVELKDQKTKNLDAVESQAFNYHNSHSNSKYIIISNFDELRFYIDKKTAYEKFSLFNLDYEEFKKLHLLLSYESIKNDTPLKLKEKSASFEQNISKSLYRDFSLFRTHLFENIVKNNDLEKSLLLRLTQKLCDRIIFILFAEDRGLLTPNTIKEIRERHNSDGFGDRSMYDYYKLYFNAINKGNEKLSIPKYNGGLFTTDETLDSLIIDDAYLDMEAQKLSDYDFLSDIGVNILGHIFEQSLTDLEEINASINDTEFDSKKSKRKKDGVFYTPEYITKYIVDNTLGKLCHEKKEELNLTNITPPLNPKKPTKQEQIQKENLEEYRNWLLNLKILDPACGSGAFLNQALDFLIREHESLQKDLVIMGDITAYYEIEKSILEHNIYGVDINEDAVEIAKLSLWLRTAQKGRCLTNLNDKIKCGNSLIDDKSVAENAFVWEDEFPEVFAKVMIDTNIISNFTDNGGGDKTDKFIKHSKELFDCVEQGKVKLIYSTMGEFETNNLLDEAKKIIHLKLIEPLPKECGLLMWDSGGGLDTDIWATNEQITLFEDIKIIMIGERHNKIMCDKDAAILCSACINQVKHFITNNDKDFIKDGRREALEKLTGIKIFTSSEFIEYFKDGKYNRGFDIVIGNPPYGAQLSEEHKKYLKKNYSTTEYNFDTYNFFFELAIELLKEDGYLGFITPNTFLVVENSVLLRDLIFKQNRVVELFESFDVFPDAVIEPITSIIQKKASKDNDDFRVLLESRDKKTIEERYFTHQYVLSKNKIIFNYRETLHEKNLYEKVISQTYFLSRFANVTSGIKPYQVGKGIPQQTKKTLEDKPFTRFEQKEGWLPLIRGTQVNRYSVQWDGEYIDYGQWLAEPRKPEIFFNPKIFIRRTDDKLLCAYDDQNFIGLNSIHCAQSFDETIDNKYLLALMNSKLTNWFFRHENFHMVGKPLAEVKVVFVERLPIVKIVLEKQKIFIEKTDKMLSLGKQLQETKQNFLNELGLEKIPQKLQNFEELTFDEFVAQFAKAKKLKFADKLQERNFKQEWQSLFENDKALTCKLKEEISTTDKEIDKMVYELYELSDDEIKIVEGI